MSWNTRSITDPRISGEGRFADSTIDGVNARLEAEGYATGLDVWANIQDAYIEHYLRGDADLGYAQLTSLLEAIRNDFGT